MTSRKGWYKERNRHSFASKGVKTRKKIGVGVIQYPLIDDMSIAGYGGIATSVKKPKTKKQLYMELFNYPVSLRPNIMGNLKYYYYIKAFDDKEMKAILMADILERLKKSPPKTDKRRVMTQLLLEEIFDRDPSWKKVYKTLTGEEPKELNEIREIDVELLELFREGNPDTTITKVPVYPPLLPVIGDEYFITMSDMKLFYIRLLNLHREDIWKYLDDIQDGLTPEERTKQYIYNILLAIDYHRVNTPLYNINQYFMLMDKESIEVLKDPFPDNPRTLYELLSKPRPNLHKGIVSFTIEQAVKDYKLLPNQLDVLLLTDKRIFKKYRPAAEMIPLYVNIVESDGEEDTVRRYYKEIQVFHNKAVKDRHDDAIREIQNLIMSKEPYDDYIADIVKDIRREAVRILTDKTIKHPEDEMLKYLEEKRSKITKGIYLYDIYTAFIEDLKRSVIFEYEIFDRSEQEYTTSLWKVANKGNPTTTMNLLEVITDDFREALEYELSVKATDAASLNIDVWSEAVKEISSKKNIDTQTKLLDTITDELEEADTLYEYRKVLDKYAIQIDISKRDKALLERMIEIVDKIDLKDEYYNEQIKDAAKIVLKRFYEKPGKGEKARHRKETVFSMYQMLMAVAKLK